MGDYVPVVGHVELNSGKEDDLEDRYHETYLKYDNRRSVLWRTLIRYHFAKFIPHDSTVLDLGAGYADFINEVQAKKKIAVDLWPGLRDHALPDVEVIIGSVTDLTTIDDSSVDLAFASNVFEHLTHAELKAVLRGLSRILSPRGRLLLLQPNYYYAYRKYFDDYTHVSIFSHVSIAEFLTANGFTVTDVKPRFLPLTIKGRLPVHPWLIRAYLALPIKPLAKQMLISARASSTNLR